MKHVALLIDNILCERVYLGLPALGCLPASTASKDAIDLEYFVCHPFYNLWLDGLV